MPESILNWGIDLILQLQAAMPDWTLGIWKFFSFLGNEEWFLLMLPFVLWCIDSKMGIRVGIYLATGAFLANVLKVYLHDPRPFWLDSNVRSLSEVIFEFGIPSGHSLIATVIWGGLAATIRRNWAWITAGFIVFMIGLSRIVLGVHFPTDVLVGWLIGGILLYLLVIFEDRITGFFDRFSFPGQVGLALLPVIAVILMGFAVNDIVETSFAIPQAWIDRASAAGNTEFDPFNETVYVTNAAVFFGAVVGYSWLALRGGMDASGPWRKRILRFAAGLVVTIALWAGLDMVFAALAEDATLLGMLLRFIRYGLIGFWATGIGPVVFKRLGWADGVSESRP